MIWNRRDLRFQTLQYRQLRLCVVFQITQTWGCVTNILENQVRKEPQCGGRQNVIRSASGLRPPDHLW